jgi:DNA-binding NarL/FixJ family response regulator
LTPIRILVVEDFDPFRRFIVSTLQTRPEFRLIFEASDGLEAVQKAEELRPDLILLDIGLPTLTGIEAARRIRKLIPESKIVFLSQESSADVVQEALTLGALGYIVKSNAGRELLTAVDTVLRGGLFIGSSFANHDFTGTSNAQPPKALDNAFIPIQHQDVKTARQHEVEFYADDSAFLDGFTRFIEAALKIGNAVVVMVSAPHRNSLHERLRAGGLDIGAAIDQGKYISLDRAEALPLFMVNDMPDPNRFFKVTGDRIRDAAKAAKGDHPRVAACGECSPLLWELGNADAAIALEQLWDEIARTYDVDILCGYSLGSFQGAIGSQVFEKICAEHSAVHSR